MFKVEYNIQTCIFNLQLLTSFVHWCLYVFSLKNVADEKFMLGTDIDVLTFKAKFGILLFHGEFFHLNVVLLNFILHLHYV